jgi:hypothetical protein
MTKYKESSTCLVKFRMPDDQTHLKVSQMLACWLTIIWHDFRSALFWDFTQDKVVIPFRRFGTKYGSHIQGSSSQRWDRKIPEERRSLSQRRGAWHHAWSVSTARLLWLSGTTQRILFKLFLLSTMITRWYSFILKIAFYWNTVKIIQRNAVQFCSKMYYYTSVYVIILNVEMWFCCAVFVWIRTLFVKI